MKLLLFCGLLFFGLVGCMFPQKPNNNSIESKRYLLAYDYIKTDPVNVENRMYVMDTIIDPDWHWFSNELSDYPDNKKWVEEYRAGKKFQYERNRYSSVLDSLFQGNKSEANTVLIFSDITNDMLIAEIVEKKLSLPYGTPVWAIDKMRSFTESYMYLFLFNESTIKRVFKIEMMYD